MARRAAHQIATVLRVAKLHACLVSDNTIGLSRQSRSAATTKYRCLFKYRIVINTPQIQGRRHVSLRIDVSSAINVNVIHRPVLCYILNAWIYHLHVVLFFYLQLD